MTAIEHTCVKETTGLLTTFQSVTLPRWKEMEEETVSVKPKIHSVIVTIFSLNYSTPDLFSSLKPVRD